MATIDLTLNGFTVPRIPAFTPPWGTVQTDPEHFGLSTGEAVNNMMMPLNRMRPFTVTENSATTVVEADSTIVLAGSASSLAIGSGAYVGCKVTVINRQTNAVTVIGGTRIYTIAALWVMALVWDGAVWKNWIQDNEKPVGTYYTQYPATAANDYAAAFPSSERPASLFGGTWSIVWDTEKVFFRTGGGQEAEDDRTAGYQGDAIRNIKGLFGANGFYYSYPSATGPFYTTGGNNYRGDFARLEMDNGYLNFDSSRIVPTAVENRPVNRRIIVWKKTAL